MAQTKAAAGGLQVDEDRSWQEEFWTAQRIGWLLMALFILAALLGLTGKGGPFASATAQSPGGTIDYPQITRWQSDEQVTLRLPETARGEVEVGLSPGFTRVFAVDSIVPEPSASEAGENGLAFTFDVRDGGEKSIAFNVTTRKPVIGQRVMVRVGNSRPAVMTVTVLP